MRRKVESDRSTAVADAVDFERTLMHLDQLLGQRQAQAAAAALAVERVAHLAERLEHDLQILLGDGGGGVLDLDHQPVALKPCLDRNRASGRREADAVAEQIEHDLTQAPLVSADRSEE